MDDLVNYAVVEAGEPWLCIARGNRLDIFYKGEKTKSLDGFRSISALMIVDDTLFVADEDSIMIINLLDYTKKVLLQGVNGCKGFEFVHTNLFMALADQIKIAVLNIDHLQTQIMADVKQGLTGADAVAFDDDRLWILDTQSGALGYMLGREFFEESFEGSLNNPIDMTLGRYGDGCGAGRLFIADMGNDQVKVYNPEDKSMQVLIKEIKKPASISKSKCKLYISTLENETIYCFDLKSLSLEILELEL